MQKDKMGRLSNQQQQTQAQKTTAKKIKKN